MIEFRTLGRVELRRLEGGAARSVRLQPKRAALLAYLAVATPRQGHRRDGLLALLWPDHDESRARNALRQALHGIRQALGEDVLVTAQDGEVAIEPDRVWCDVAVFEDALDRGDLETAVSLYRGPFLGGFYLSGAPEFERWVDIARERLGRRYRAALEELAERAEERGEYAEAAEWWRKAAGEDRFSAHVALRLMRALAANGDRAGAIRYAERHDAIMREELEAEPDPHVAELAEDLRKRPRRADPPGAGVSPTGQSTPAVFLSPASEPPSLRSRWRPPRWSRRTVWAVGAAALIALLLVVRLVAPAAGDPRAATELRLAVLPFENLGTSDDDHLVAGVTDELTARLAGTGAIAIISSNSTGQYRETDKSPTVIGRELGARYILLGSVKRELPGDTASRMRITPQLLRASDGTHVWAGVYVADLNDLFDATSQIASAIGEILEIGTPEAGHVAAVTGHTPVVEAYEYYLRGREYYRRAHSEVNLRAAEEMFAQAVRLDPRFALGYAALSQVHSDMYWYGSEQNPERLQLAESAVREALRLDPALPEAHSALGTYEYRCCLELDAALEHYGEAQRLRPGIDLDASFGSVLRQAGRWDEALVSLGRAVELDPRSAHTAAALGKTYLLLRRFDEAARYLNRAIALDPQSSEAYDGLAQVHLFGYGDAAAARRVVDEAAGKLAHQVGMEPIVSFYQRRYREALGPLFHGTTRVPTLTYVVGHGASVPSYLHVADMHRYLGDTATARAYYDSARVELERKLEHPPSLPSAHSSLRSRLGRAYAGLGLDADAIREGLHAVRLGRDAGDAIMTPAAMQDLAAIYVLVGEYDAAIDQLEASLAVPSLMTAPRLRLSPTWDALRTQPRFQRLLRTR